jgi:release factor glutamine methyltransferase
MKIKEILKRGEDTLLKAGIVDAKLDAFYLLEYCFFMSRMDYLLSQEKEGEPEKTKEYFALIEKRSRHIPLQHLTGEQVFMGHSFFVNEDVLIPRQDTESLVEVLLSLAKEKRVLDLCTGSGCILLSLTLGCKLKKAVGADISPKALSVAKTNEKRLMEEALYPKEGLFWIESDIFEKIEGEFDLIVSNPPYIETKEIDTLMPEVRLYEPYLALDGKEDGLFFYRKIIEKAADYLSSDGILAFEIGYQQGEAVKSLMEAAGYQNVEVKQDLAGLDRIVIGGSYV